MFLRFVNQDARVRIVLAMLKRVATLAKVFPCFTSLHISNLSSIIKTILFLFLTAAVAIARNSSVIIRTANFILSRKKTSFFGKLNQTLSILLQFTQDLHLLTAYHQTKTLISRFFLLMPPILRNGSFLFVLQSQPFYLAQLVPVTTISIREAPFSSSDISPNATCTYDDHFHLGSLVDLNLKEKLYVCLALFIGEV